MTAEEDNSGWPRTVEQAVAALMTWELSDDDREFIRSMEKSELIQLHFGLGRSIRNEFGLWAGNDELMMSALGEVGDPDTVAGVIIEAFWRALQ